MRRWLLLPLLAACTTVPKVSQERLAAVHQAEDEELLKGCKRLGRFSGSSTQVGDPGLEQARNEARAKCVQAGATDFAYVNESVTPDATTVAATAWDCRERK